MISARFFKFQPYLSIEKYSPHVQPIIENHRPDVDGRAVLAWFFAQKRDGQNQNYIDIFENHRYSRDELYTESPIDVVPSTICAYALCFSKLLLRC